MVVTFFIGNGYDLSLGLKTSYYDFLKYYIKTLDRNNPNIEKFKRDIRKGIANWSNAELAIGKYSEIFSQSDLDVYCKCCEDFQSKLSIYLKKEQSKKYFGKSEYQYKSGIKHGLTNFSEYLLPESKKAVKAIEDAHILENRTINIINFNYTNTLDWLIEYSHRIDVRKVGKKDFFDEIGELIQIHGTTTNTMIMGVNNESQIANRTFRSEKKIRQLLIKPELNKLAHTGNLDICSSIIKSSNIICIFGMSIGVTDAIWWEKLSDWVSSDQSHNLIIYSYSKNYDPLLPRNYLEIESNIKDTFFQYSSLTQDKAEEFYERIHVCINSGIFKFSSY